MSPRTPSTEERRIYLADLDILAESIARLFSRKRSDDCQGLSVITWGNAEYTHCVLNTNGEEIELLSGMPITYKVRRKMTEFGLLTKVKRMDPRTMEYEEPISYVADEDTDQGLSLEAYSWGVRY